MGTHDVRENRAESRSPVQIGIGLQKKIQIDEISKGSGFDVNRENKKREKRRNKTEMLADKTS